VSPRATTRPVHTAPSSVVQPSPSITKPSSVSVIAGQPLPIGMHISTPSTVEHTSPFSNVASATPV
jgi:hypothetical protein